MKAVHFNIKTSVINQMFLTLRFILLPKDAIILRYLWLFGDMPLGFFTKGQKTLTRLEKEGFVEIKEDKVYFPAGGTRKLSNEENQMKYFIEILWENKNISMRDKVFLDSPWLRDAAERLVKLKMISFDKELRFYYFPEWLGG